MTLNLQEDVSRLISLRQPGERPERRELGVYIAILKTQKASEDVTFIIDQIRRLHRNPLMHPEDTLTPDEALDLFLLCRSAISTTISDMEAKKLFDTKDEKAVIVRASPS